MAASFYLSRIISSRYFKADNISHFFNSIAELKRLGISCHPRIAVFKSASKVKRSLDILLDTGVSIEHISKELNTPTIFLQSFFSEVFYQKIKEIKASDILAKMNKKGFDTVVFDRVKDFLIYIVDSDVEMRGIKDR